MHWWRIQTVVLWEQKQKEWRRDRAEERSCGQGGGVVEDIRQDNMLKDGDW